MKREGLSGCFNSLEWSQKASKALDKVRLTVGFLRAPPYKFSEITTSNPAVTWSETGNKGALSTL